MSAGSKKALTSFGISHFLKRYDYHARWRDPVFEAQKNLLK